jgi:molecular chaperone DnaK (HSP70)
MARIVGVDLGNQKSILVLDDGEIFRSDTGSIAVPTLVTFAQRARYVGDEAASFQSPDGTVSLLPLCLASSHDEVESDASLGAMLQHSSSRLLGNADRLSYLEINYCGNIEKFSPAEVLAIPLGQYARRLEAVYGPDVRLAFPVPHGTKETAAAAIVCAARIAGIQPDRVDVLDSAEALVAAYNRKLAALRPVDVEALHVRKPVAFEKIYFLPIALNVQDKVVVIIDMGHVQSTVVAVRVLVHPKEGTAASKTEAVATPVGVAASTRLGALSFDHCLYEHLSRMVEQKYKVSITPGSKRGLRLLKACERLRKLLSQLAEAQVSIENVTDNGDFNFSLRRDELAALCSRPLQELKDLLQKAVPATEAVAGVEVLGGGVRMHLVQSALAEVLGEVM